MGTDGCRGPGRSLGKVWVTRVLVKPPIYGLDIAFETRPVPDEGPHDGMMSLESHERVIVAAGLSTIDGDEYYDGSERRILSVLDQRFAVLDPGIITTWNGSVVGLPLLRARARSLHLGLGLRLRPDRRSNRRLAGAWHRQRHLDLRWVYDDPEPGPDPAANSADPCRGAHLARSLAERRWNRARRHLDRVPPAEELTSYAWTCLSDEAETGPMVTIPRAAKLRHPSNRALRTT